MSDRNFAVIHVLDLFNW
uniref:Uncharacterized protein n=1 Tax=Arundo donax TaxID=35708 RepID=A0A0A9AC17_ARUDO